MSTTPEIVPISETISQTAQEGLGVGGEVIAKSEMPEIGYSGETSQPGQEVLGVGGEVVAKSEMPEIRQSDVETSQPVVSGSTSETSMGAAFDCDPKSEQMGGVHSKGKESDARIQNPIGLDEILTAGPKLQSVSEKESVKVELFEASKDSEWFDAVETKNCKVLLQLFRSDRRLWVQTGFKGRSVLHVAVMQGCSELVRELHIYEGDLVPRGKNWKTPFEFLWENARDGRLKDASVQDIWLVMEGPSLKIRDHILELRDLSIDRSRIDYIKSHVECTMRVDNGLLSLRRAIDSIPIEEDFEDFEDLILDLLVNVAVNDVDFNFEDIERNELFVHMACSLLVNLLRNGVRDEEEWVMSGCALLALFIIAIFTYLDGKNLLVKLFDQKDAQGRTVLQVLVECPDSRDHGSDRMAQTFENMLQILPEICVNALDKGGRTVLHWAVAHHCNWAVEELLKSGKARYDVRFQTAYIRDITAFHLNILYDMGFSVGWNLKDELARRFYEVPIYEVPSVFQGEMDALLWAVRTDRNIFMKCMLEAMVYEDVGPPMDNAILSMAAWSGNVEILQYFLQKYDVDQVNIVADLYNSPPLHLAVQATAQYLSARQFHYEVHCNDFISVKLLEKNLREKENSVNANTNKTIDVVNRYSAKQVCVNLLLQAGADILLTDKYKRMADPGYWASNEARQWWYELVAKETLNIKNDLNAAGTGTAVVATLVATASFVGPLQPPLNYVAMSSGTATVDFGVQVTEVLIKIFLVSNSLSFYLAITSIMLAIMPSLPISKEGLVFGPCDDIKRSRRTISIAIGMLLASIISVLISFAASSLAVIPLQHRGLMAYSTSIGGFICCIGIFFFFLRFLRLICPRNTFIKKLYQRIGKL